MEVTHSPIAFAVISAALFFTCLGIAWEARKLKKARTRRQFEVARERGTIFTLFAIIQVLCLWLVYLGPEGSL